MQYQYFLMFVPALMGVVLLVYTERYLKKEARKNKKRS